MDRHLHPAHAAQRFASACGSSGCQHLQGRAVLFCRKFQRAMSIRLLACRLCQRAQLHTRRGHLHGKWCILPLPRHPQVSTRLQALYAAVCSATKEDNIAAASDDFRSGRAITTPCAPCRPVQAARCFAEREKGAVQRRVLCGRSVDAIVVCRPTKKTVL